MKKQTDKPGVSLPVLFCFSVCACGNNFTVEQARIEHCRDALIEKGRCYAQYSAFLTKNIGFSKLIGLDLSVDRF